MKAAMLRQFSLAWNATAWTCMGRGALRAPTMLSRQHIAAAEHIAWLHWMACGWPALEAFASARADSSGVSLRGQARGAHVLGGVEPGNVCVRIGKAL